jgi:hypothetical protein
MKQAKGCCPHDIAGLKVVVTLKLMMDGKVRSAEWINEEKMKASRRSGSRTGAPILWTFSLNLSLLHFLWFSHHRVEGSF